MKLPLRRPAALLAASVATLAVALPSTALAHPHKAKEYSLGAKFAVPTFTTGPDGALWYVSGNEGKVGRLDVDG